MGENQTKLVDQFKHIKFGLRNLNIFVRIMNLEIFLVLYTMVRGRKNVKHFFQNDQNLKYFYDMIDTFAKKN